MLDRGLWRLLEGVNREVRLELALTEWAGALWWSIGIPGTGNGEHKAHSVSWGNHSVHIWHRAVGAWVSDRLGRRQGENEGLAGRRIWMLFCRQPLKGFQEGSEMIRYSFKKDCSDREREAGLEGWGHGVQWRGPSLWPEWKLVHT